MGYLMGGFNIQIELTVTNICQFPRFQGVKQIINKWDTCTKLKEFKFRTKIKNLHQPNIISAAKIWNGIQFSVPAIYSS